MFGVVTILCAGAGAILLHIYDNATRPDRTTPAIAVQNYLFQALQANDDTAAAKYSCSAASVSAITKFRDDAVAAAKAREDEAGFTWTLGTVQTTGNGGIAAVELERDTTNHGKLIAASTTEWSFDLRDGGDGWRVCGARQVG